MHAFIASLAASSALARDREYVAKVARLKTYQEQARRGEVILLFADEINLHLLPGIAGC
jgi:hypothetical protein